MSKRPTFSIDPEKPPVEQINKEYLRLTEKFYAAYNALHVMKTPSRNSRRNATKTVNKFNGSVQMKEAFSLLNKGIAAAIIYDENKPREEQDCCNIVIEKSKLFHYMNEPVKAYNTLADEIERVEALGQEPHGRLYLSLAMIDSAAGRHDEAADWLEQLIDHLLCNAWPVVAYRNVQPLLIADRRQHLNIVGGLHRVEHEVGDRRR